MLTRALLIANVLAFIWSSLHGGDTTEGLVNLGAFYGPLVASGDWWRFLTSVFLHANILHIATNMFVLWQVGTVVEGVFGPWRMAAVYACAIVGSGFAVYTFSFNEVTVGASGAIFGLVGAYGAVGLRLGKRGRELVRTTIGFVILNLVVGLVVPNISQAAHLGGLLAGALAGFALWSPPRPAPVVHVREAATGAVIEGELLPPERR